MLFNLRLHHFQASKYSSIYQSVCQSILYTSFCTNVVFRSVTSSYLLDVINQQLTRYNAQPGSSTGLASFLVNVAVPVIKAIVTDEGLCSEYKELENKYYLADFWGLWWFLSPPCNFTTAINDRRFELDGVCQDNNTLCRYYQNGAHNCVRNVDPFR